MIQNRVSTYRLLFPFQKCNLGFCFLRVVFLLEVLPRGLSSTWRPSRTRSGSSDGGRLIQILMALLRLLLFPGKSKEKWRQMCTLHRWCFVVTDEPATAMTQKCLLFNPTVRDSLELQGSFLNEVVFSRHIQSQIRPQSTSDHRRLRPHRNVYFVTCQHCLWNG